MLVYNPLPGHNQTDYKSECSISTPCIRTKRDHKEVGLDDDASLKNEHQIEKITHTNMEGKNIKNAVALNICQKRVSYLKESYSD